MLKSFAAASRRRAAWLRESDARLGVAKKQNQKAGSKRGARAKPKGKPMGKARVVRDKTRRLCVIGAGRWGRNHLRTLKEMGCLAGVVEPNSAVRDELAALYPDVALYAGLREAADAGFDGFTVATPAETHFEIAKYLLELGKPVLVEKPLALRSIEARELARIAEKQGVQLMTGHVMLFHPAIEAIGRRSGRGSWASSNIFIAIG
jgi:shikimate 5-dehydrogenase